MTIQFREAYHFGEIVSQLIGVGTVLRGIAWLYKRKEEKFEDKVIDTLRKQEGRFPWRSARGVVSRMRREAAYNYARALFPPRVVSWSSFGTRLSVIPWRMRYFYQRNLVIPSIRKADRTLRTLWKRGLLVCPPENPALYQLRY